MADATVTKMPGLRRIFCLNLLAGLAAGGVILGLARLFVGPAVFGLPFVLSCLAPGICMGAISCYSVRLALTRQLRRQLELMQPLSGETAVPGGSAEALQENLVSTVGKIEERIGRVLGAVEGAAPLYRSMSEAGRYLAERAQEGLAAARRARSDVEALAQKQQQVMLRVDALSESSRNEAALSRELYASLEEMAEAMDQSTARFLETTSSVDQVAASILGASAQAEEIVRTVEKTARNLDDIGDSLERVRSGASASARSASAVSQDAASGLQVVQASMEEMGRIEQESQRALAAMQRLSSQTGEVVKIIEVIKELVSDTELLAFNAAIIAAKAGEEGRGFSVVAEEIRDLADRTTASAQDIHRIIQAIGGDTREVLEAVESTGMRIAKGKQLSLSTGEALRKIVDSSGQATAASEEIAELTGRQAQRARALLDDAGSNLRSVRGIARAMQEQQSAIVRIQEGVGQMKAAADQIARSMEEQVRANREFDAGIAARQEQVGTISEATRFQMETVQHVFDHFAASEKRLQGNAEKVGAVSDRIAELQTHTGQLRELIASFERCRRGDGGRPAVATAKR